MSEQELPEEVPSLMVPMQGRPWLIPNILVAEVIPLRQPERPGKGAEWLLGWLDWRDEEIPLISFERLNDSGAVHIGEDARLAVLNTVTDKLPFYAVVIQGIPRQLRVARNDPVEEPVETGPAELAYVQLGGELATLPDLDAIERALVSLQSV